MVMQQVTKSGSAMLTASQPVPEAQVFWNRNIGEIIWISFITQRRS